jgi:hypothetical protein
VAEAALSWIPYSAIPPIAIPSACGRWWAFLQVSAVCTSFGCPALRAVARQHHPSLVSRRLPGAGRLGLNDSCQLRLMSDRGHHIACALWMKVMMGTLP